MADYELLRKKPFCLNNGQIAWVKESIAGMTLEEKLGQLFCMFNYDEDPGFAQMLNAKYHVGGWMGRTMPLDSLVRVINAAQKTAKIPLLIAANFEAGGDGLIAEGTNVGPNLQIGATGEVEMARKQAYVCAREGLAMGANFAFAPVIDINYNFQNPIMGTRLFSEDSDFVAEAGKAYTETAQGLGMAVSIKHFPGDGVDSRDQHLVTSINSLSCEEWDGNYGKAYQKCIEAGALTVMVGHIMHPEYSRKLCPGIRDEDILPASLSPEILNGLLREKLGFNGMIITDSTAMGGMGIPMSRRKLVPTSIAAGCDMFLFTKNMDEDFGYMRRGYEEGIITDERLETALIRILGVKAALRLPERKEDGSIYMDAAKAKNIVGCPEHKAIEKECSDKAVTLVKSKEDIFPITPEKYPRIRLYPYGMEQSYFGGGGDVIGAVFKKRMEQEGFQVDIFEAGKGLEGMVESYDEVVNKYDLIFYISDLQTKSNQTTVRIEWKAIMGVDVPMYIQDIPTVYISFANPYHLQDVPRIKTYINAYKFKDAVCCKG